MEVDWNSLFASFFGMVRVKIACKEVAKISGKRMFEMKQNTYLIQFKVENGEGIKDGRDNIDGDDNDPSNGDDTGLEEFEHDLSQGIDKTSGQDKGAKSADKPTSSYSTPAGSRKVDDWASLFQNKDEGEALGRSEIGHYSCTKLLREMEVAMSDSGDEDSVMAREEDELTLLSRGWLEKTLEDSEMRDLPDNLYVMLELAEQLDGGTIMSDNQLEEDKKPKAREDKQKWGPILVEKRPCSGRQDGKTVMEKAQDRKRMANLDGVGGNSKSYNSFLVLSNREIASIASIVGVDLG
jgi:hypothetical protein